MTHETMPAVTVLASMSGFPTATTHSPVRRSAEVPSVAAGNGPLAPRRRTTAMSETVSRASTSPSKVRPSARVTETEGPEAEAPEPRARPVAAASATTWALVRTVPSASMKKPEPLLARPRMELRRPDLSAVMFTTEGPARSAASAMEKAVSGRSRLWAWAASALATKGGGSAMAPSCSEKGGAWEGRRERSEGRGERGRKVIYVRRRDDVAPFAAPQSERLKTDK